MVFEPTFEEFDEKATALPDVTEEGDAEIDAPPLDGDLPDDELPPVGE